MNKAANRRNFRRWLRKHRKLHKLRTIHCNRKANGFYDAIPAKIRKWKKELANYQNGIANANYRTEWIRKYRGYYTKLPDRIEKYQRIYKQYKAGVMPQE